MTESRVVVISGQVSSGKTLAGKMLRDRGYQYARISQAIRTRWNKANGEKPPRSWYQEVGMDLHNTIGQSALCEETMAFIPRPSNSFVIDGARWREDVAYFRKVFGTRTTHIHLTAAEQIRRKRFEDREKDVSFEEADDHEVEQEIPYLAPMADVVFDNSVDDQARLRAFLEAFLAGANNAC